MDLDTFTFTSKILVMKLTSAGDIDISLKKTFGGGASISGGFIKMDDDSYLLSGSITPSSTTPNDDDVLFGKYDSSFSPQWVKTFGGTGSDMGAILPDRNRYLLTGETDSFSASTGVDDIFGITLNSNGEFPGCSYIKDVFLTVGSPDITVTDLGWIPTPTTLTPRTQPISLNEITLHTDPIPNLTASDICTGTPEVGLSVTPSENLNSLALKEDLLLHPAKNIRFRTQVELQLTGPLQKHRPG